MGYMGYTILFCIFILERYTLDMETRDDKAPGGIQTRYFEPKIELK